MLYPVAHTFRSALDKQANSLKVFGYRIAKHNYGNRKVFEPSPEQVAECREAYLQQLEATGKRPQRSVYTTPESHAKAKAAQMRAGKPVSDNPEINEIEAMWEVGVSK